MMATRSPTSESTPWEATTAPGSWPRASCWPSARCRAGSASPWWATRRRSAPRCGASAPRRASAVRVVHAAERIEMSEKAAARRPAQERLVARRADPAAQGRPGGRGLQRRQHRRGRGHRPARPGPARGGLAAGAGGLHAQPGRRHGRARRRRQRGVQAGVARAVRPHGRGATRATCWGGPSRGSGLLSIGEEDTKGNALVLETLPLLRRARHLNFIGNVEGRDILKGTCDVVVTDGFTGNVVLKTAEGVAGHAGAHGQGGDPARPARPDRGPVPAARAPPGAGPRWTGRSTAPRRCSA